MWLSSDPIHRWMLASRSPSRIWYPSWTALDGKRYIDKCRVHRICCICRWMDVRCQLPVSPDIVRALAVCGDPLWFPWGRYVCSALKWYLHKSKKNTNNNVLLRNFVSVSGEKIDPTSTNAQQPKITAFEPKTNINVMLFMSSKASRHNRPKSPCC